MKKIKMMKKILIMILIFGISFVSFASVVGDYDGSAFVNKKDFEDLKREFAIQIDNYSDSIDRKIDGAIASYLYGVQVAAKTELTSILNKINEKCNDSKMVGTTETKYNYRCMAKEYTAPTTQKPEGAIVNLFYAITKIQFNQNGSSGFSYPNQTSYASMWHRVAMDHESRTGLFDIDVPASNGTINRKNGKYIMLDKSDNYPGKYYAVNRYNDITYRYYTTGSGVAKWNDGWPDFDATDWDVVWVFPTFEITETEYWKVELGTAAAYWNSVGGLTSYDDINVMYGPSYDATESINVIPIVGSINETVYGLLTNDLTRMKLQDTSYDWNCYAQSRITRIEDAIGTNRKQIWQSPWPTPTITFKFNCHPYDANVKIEDLIDYEATVAYADEEKKTVAIYGGLPIFRATGNGEVTMKIEFMSDLNNDVYVGLSKSQFANNATYTIDSDLNLRNENDVKYTNNKFEHDKEYTFKMDVRKDDVIWIKTYDANNTKGFTGAKTNSIILVEE